MLFPFIKITRPLARLIALPDFADIRKIRLAIPIAKWIKKYFFFFLSVINDL